MKKTHAITLAASLGVALAYGAGNEITVGNMPPSVVKTVPACGDTEVDPDLKEITVTFSKDMMTEKMWSVCQISSEHYPKRRKDLFYRDGRTFVFPVILKPGKTYVMWFNRAQYNSFRDTGNRPAVPYQLVFKTKDK
ncbi:hypothetical protein PDESU_06520 [Pontiella desulfatans]|uniref:SbsA Ig-like domain-containing protein n=1 Tax=Pontiella desulfatans TaxID=2750659 RepID=A0A6C2UCK6_PONDE|nr:Ig-like domain-containing protein [Pontiella desulfatans]VGO17918.1 hypothetical protein PDESU_06520 [Pontiella desulfatans]